jgi:hypothetical protein
MPFAVATKNAMLDAITFDRIRLHSGDPGAAGTDNALGAGLSAATFSAASSGSRALASAVEVTGLTANQSVTHFSVWTNSGTVFRASGAISSGDVTANSAGEFSLAVGTTLDLDDPA